MRSLLLGIITLGSVASGIGFTGVIAPTTDTAKTGTVTKERVETGVFPTQVDLKLARWIEPANGVPGSCGPYSDELKTGIFQFNAGSNRSFDRDVHHVCVKNAGAASLSWTAKVDPGSITLTELSCAPDETATNPNGCKLGFAQGPTVAWMLRSTDANCPTRMNAGAGYIAYLSEDTYEASSDFPLSPGKECVYEIQILDRQGTGFENGLPDDAQTDALEWRFVFEAHQ